MLLNKNEFNSQYIGLHIHRERHRNRKEADMVEKTVSIQPKRVYICVCEIFG